MMDVWTDDERDYDAREGDRGPPPGFCDPSRAVSKDVALMIALICGVCILVIAWWWGAR